MIDRRLVTADIREDAKHVRQEWAVERFSWFAGALILFAAVAGFLGSGLFSNAVTTSSDKLLTAHYRRFIRYGEPVRLTLKLAPDGVDAATLVFTVNRRFIDSAELTTVSPAPLQVMATNQGNAYFIAAEPDRAIEVSVRYKADKRFGKIPVRIAFSHGPAVQFDQFVYP